MKQAETTAGQQIKNLFNARSNNLIPPFYLWIGLVLIAMFSLLPFIYLFTSSLSETQELLAGHLIPKHVTWTNYIDLFKNGDYLQALKNSISVSVMTTIFTLVIAIFAAYAFARVEFPFRMTALFLILAMQILPSISILVPTYMMMRNGIQIGIPFTNIIFFTTPPLLDTIWSLVVAYTTFTLPFAIWLLTGFLQSMPAELEEAASVDGSGRLRTMFSIILPLALPGIAATGIYIFLNVWDEFMFANSLTQTVASKTLPVVIREFIGKNSLDWGPMTAGGFLASLPPVVIALFFYRYIVGGLTTGGVKE
jgi:multiple sugar transport system permease protein